MSSIKWESKSDQKSESKFHPDYNSNYAKFQNWIEKEKTTFPEELKVYIADSEGYKKSLVWFIYNPPLKAPFTGCAESIFLHQSSDVVKNEKDRLYSTYRSIINSSRKKYPKEGAKT